MPGNLQSPYSEDCNLLIKRMKATIYTGCNDVAEALFWSKPGEVQSQKPALDLANRDEEEQAILTLWKEKGQIEIDELCYLTDIPLGRLSSKLLTLEFEAIVKPLPGEKFRLLF